MISHFLESWELFASSYLAGWLIAVALALMGVVVVARDQIFIGAAVAQSSTLGLAAAMSLAPWLGLEAMGQEPQTAEAWLALSSVMAVGSAVLASVLISWRSGSGRESHEAITGFVFLLAGGTAILLVAHSPHGLEEVHRLLASSIIGATTADVALFATMACLIAIALRVAHRRILLVILDEETAGALGLRVGLWKLALAIGLGLVLGLALRSAGLLYSFGFLVLPALVAKNICRRLHTMFFVAPGVALVAAVAGFIIANERDWPPAQAAVVMLGLLLPPAWLVRRFRRH